METVAQAPHVSPVRRGSMFVPSATALLTGLCIMVVELVAGNVVAPHLGQNLYTWTSIIGAILGGIALGNYIGGRLADRHRPSRTLAMLFLLAAGACVAIRYLNDLVGAALAAQPVEPARIIQHIVGVFVLPGILLGTMGPVIARMALDRSPTAGRAVGTVYAWNAAGSIAGTFLTGFVLVPWLPTSVILWLVAAVLGVLGLLFAMKR